MAGTHNPSMLEKHRIRNAPSSMYYIANFITEEEEEYILNKIPANKWISLSRRRLQALPARLTATNTLIASTGLPEWLLKPAVQRIDELGIFKDSPHGTVNHCLINEYLPGQGIMPHEDGAAYHPVVATVSLGGTLVLDVTQKKAHHPADDEDDSKERPAQQTWRILQEPRSLLVTTGSAYTDTLHGITEVEVDEDLHAGTVANWDMLRDREGIEKAGGRSVRQTRISLTFRDVLKVSNAGLKILGRGRT